MAYTWRLFLITVRILVVTASLQNNAAETNSSPHHKGWREVQSVIWLGFGLYLFVALLTYSPLDPGWSKLSSETLAVSNSAGISGAWLADLFFSFLGKAAFLLPLFCVFEVLAIWRGDKNNFKLWFRWIAQGLMLVASAGLCTLHSVETSETILNAAGGIIGLEVGQAMLQGFGLMGSSFLLGGVILLNGTLVTGFSWKLVLEALGYIPYALLLKLQASLQNKTTEYKEHQQQQQELKATTAQLEEKFELNISNPKVQSQIKPSERVEPSLGDISVLQTIDDTKIAKPTVETPQVLDELNEVLSGFTQEMPAVTPEMLAAAKADIAQHHVTDTKTDDVTIDDIVPIESIRSVEQVLPIDIQATHKEDISQQQNQDLLSADLGSFFDDDIPIVATKAEKPIEHESVKMQSPTVTNALDKVAPVIEQKSTLPHDLKIDINQLDTADINDKFVTEIETATFNDVNDEPLFNQDVEDNECTETEVVVASSLQAPSTIVEQPKTPAYPIETDYVFDDEIEDDDFEEEQHQPVAPQIPVPPVKAVQPASLPRNTLPSLELLEKPDSNRKDGFTPEQLERLSRLLEIKLKEFNIDAKVVDALPGPVVTRFEVDLAAGVKVSKITNIAKDLARSMAMISVRVVEAILGKTVIGIEVPNENRQIVRFREILDTPVYQEKESPITMALGKDISGVPMVADMARMPHLLVAGTTGSGKSVGVNAMILSILYKATPDEVRLILIDPKMLELSIYDKIPHLLTPVVTDMKDAANSLRWSVAEMERRYKLMAAVGVRNLAGFNTKLKEAEARGENILDPLWKKEDSGLQDAPPRLEPMPFIVIVIDEFADMMMIVGKKVEELIARIAQKARAAGIHLILATQRPSVDVITGLIKANVPSRIAFQVSSKIDSRTILDQGGAEQLLGHGDMLFQPIGSNLPVRIHGAFVSDDEVHRVCDHWRSCGEPNYVDEILEDYNDDGTPAKGATGGMGDEDADAEQDVLYDDAVAFVLETRRASISFVQRKFKIGYNRAARLIEAMEMAGLVSSMQSNGTREVLVPNNN